MTTLDQRDVALVGWYRTNPPPIIKALTPPDLDWSNDIIEEGGTFVLTSRINIPQHLQFFANVVLGFGQFRIPTQEEEDRFALLQREYHGVNNSSDEDADAPPVMRLSPRMIIDPTEAKSERRNALKEAVENFLDTLAKEVEGDLLGEVDAETKRLRSKKERDRRRRKAKKKKKKKNKKKGKIDGGGELVESELRTKTSEGQTMGGQGDESLASEGDQVDTHEDNVLPAASSSETIDTAVPSDENALPNNEEEEESATDDDDNDETKPVVKAETKMNNLDEPVTAAKSKPKVSYLAMAAKVPKSTKKKGAAKNTSSLPSPSTRISALDIPPVQVSATTADTVCPITEQEKIDRLEEQLSAQRRNHLELIQQVQLRAFIAETKATAALDRSRELERQILDATYPEVEATRAEAAAADTTGGGVPLSPRNGSNGPKTKEDLEHEMRSQRRENLAMMQRVQLRTYLAETKAKAAEDRSRQLEELLKDAKEGKSMT